MGLPASGGGGHADAELMASLVNDELLNAIGQVESQHNPNAIGDDGKSVGAYQMQPIAYQDVQEFFPKRFGQIPYEHLRTDPALQREAAKAYLHVGEQKYGITDLDRLISFYNAGPKARNSITNPDYINKVKGAMGKPQSRIDPIEDGLRRVYRMTAQAGFDPLSAKEIEQMLAKVDPPTALPGVKRPQPTAGDLERTATAMMHQAFQSQPEEEPRLQHPLQRGVGQPRPGGNAMNALLDPMRVQGFGGQPIPRIPGQSSAYQTLLET